MKRRSGFSLVEAVGVIVATGMLLTLSVMLLNKAFDAHRTSLLHLQRMRSLELFVERWRGDVQSCTNVTPGENLVITNEGNQEIMYSVINQSIVRTRRQDGQELEQDHWQLPSHCTASWEIDDQGHVPLLVGKLAFNGDPIQFDDLAIVSRIGIGGGK